jgi:hypothetical protein
MLSNAQRILSLAVEELAGVVRRDASVDLCAVVGGVVALTSIGEQA